MTLVKPNGTIWWFLLFVFNVIRDSIWKSLAFVLFAIALFPVRCPVYREYCINMTALGCNYFQESMETTDNRIDQLKSLNIESANTFLEENANSYGITNTLIYYSSSPPEIYLWWNILCSEKLSRLPAARHRVGFQIHSSFIIQIKIHQHIDHNAPCFSPKFCFPLSSFLGLGRL